ncbi:MAG: T9SS type A sorting domain-containing protein [Bacteroidota bacterium]
MARHSLSVVLLAIATLISAPGKAQVITTVAGTTTWGYSGDGGPALAAQMSPRTVAVGATGNLFIADNGSHVIRKVSPAGVITTYAGNSTQGYSGDGGAATAAKLNTPMGIVADGAGNLYIADQHNHAIRKVSPSGIISTIAGNGTPGYSGDGGAAAGALLAGPNAMAIDGAGNIYVAEAGNSIVRKISAAGTISTVAGNGTAGFSGDGGAATAATLNIPMGVAVDAAGNIYIADNMNHRIRKVNPAGTISTIAGTGASGFSGDGAAASAAQVSYPEGILADAAGNVYVGDYANNRIRRINTSGIITTFAGNGVGGYSGDGGAPTAAAIGNPTGMAIDATSGAFYLVGKQTPVVRRIGSPLAVNQATSSSSLSLYPNPNKGTFSLHGLQSAAGNEDAEVNVTDITGRTVYSATVRTNNYQDAQISIAGLPGGMYLLRAAAGNNLYNCRFSVEK